MTENSAKPQDVAKVRKSLASFDIVRLRELRNLLRQDLERVAYWGRLLDSRLTALDSGRPIEAIPLRILTMTAAHTCAFAEAMSYPGLMPAAEGPWSSPVTDPKSPEGQRIAREIRLNTQQLNTYRAWLKQRADLVTEELIGRYKKDPSLIESLLPKSPNAAENFAKPLSGIEERT